MKIKNIHSLGPEESTLLTPGVSGLDISKAVVVNDIIIRKSLRSISYSPPEDPPFDIIDTLEAFQCYAYKDGYTQLGLLMFELLFSEQSYLELEITQLQSEIQQFFIYVDRNHFANLDPFLKIKQKESYESYEYFVQKIDRYPALLDLQIDQHYPTFRFGYSGDCVANTDIWEKADQIIMSTTVPALVQMGALILNIGNEHNQQNEICLENPLYGVGGVSQRSIEVRFWLPLSLGFYADSIENLKF